MWKTARSGAIAALLALTMAAPAMAEDDAVTVTSVKLDRTGYLSGSLSATVRITGTITCAATGPADLTTTIARQRRAVGQDNLDLYWFPCTTTPQPFSLVVESLTCDEVASDQCFRRGISRVEVRDANNELLTTRRVFLQAAASERQTTRGPR